MSFLVHHPRGRPLFDTGVHCQARLDPAGRLGPERVDRLTVKSRAAENGRSRGREVESRVEGPGAALPPGGRAEAVDTPIVKDDGIQ